MTSRETILSSEDTEDEEKVGDGLRKNLLNEFYLEPNDNLEKLKVYLRVRPFTAEEQQNKHQSCLTISDKTVTAWAPKDSNTYKSSTYVTNKNVQSFKFSRIFSEETSQSDFYSETCQGLVKNFLNGQNCLVFAYGVTNSGKTYTVQGTPKEPGILPRTLETIFSHISSKLWHGLNLKPKMYLDVIKLSPGFESEEKQRKEELLRLASFDESDNQSTFADSGRESCTLEAQEISHDSDVNEEDLLRSTHLDDSAFSTQIKYSVWISFAEVYNENVFDLLVTPVHKKRNILKLGQDKNGNHYIRGLTEVNVSSIEEAQKMLILGQKNLHKAATKLNHNSSRSHCIFNIKLVQVVNRKNPSVAKVSMLSLCDLAGSERTCKTNSTGDRLKEAGNINTSLLTLGRCIETMRSNQIRKEFPKLIPYRDSKLTRLFQGFFNGQGEAIMIVNVNKCSRLFDETLQVFKFSAIAKQVVIQKDPLKSPTVNISPVLPVKPLSNLERVSIPWAEDASSNEPQSPDAEDETFEEELTERETGLLNIIETCKTKISWLQKMWTEERKNRMLDEIKIREEVTKELMKQFVIIEKGYSERIRASQLEAEESRDQYVLKMLTTVSSKKRSHEEMESEEKMVPLHVFEELQEKKQECEFKIEKLNRELESTKAQLRRLTLDRSQLHSEKTSLQLQLEVPGIYKNTENTTNVGDNIEQANVLNKLTSMLRDTQEKLGNKESAVNELEEQLEEAGETFKEQQEKIEQLEKMMEELKKASTECKVCQERREAGSPVKAKAESKNLTVPNNASDGAQPVDSVAEFELRERALIHGYNAEIAKYKLLVRSLRQELGFRNTSHLSPNKSLRRDLNSCLEQNELKQYLLRQVKKLQEELDKNSQCVSELLHELEVKKAAETDLEQRLEKEAKGHQQAKAAVSELREKLKTVKERCRSSSFEAEKTYLKINSEMFDSGNHVFSCKDDKDEEFVLGVKKSDENQSDHSDANKKESNMVARNKIVKTKNESPLSSIENQNDMKLSVFDNHNLKDKIINKNKEILKLQETLLSYSEMNSKYDKKIKENEELLCKLQKQETLERDLKKKVKHLEEKVEKIAVFEVEIESQVAIIQHLQTAVDEKSKLLSDLQSQSGGESPMLKRKMEEMQTVMEGLREMVDDSTKELAKSNEKLSDLENKKKMVSSLQTELETLKSSESSLKSEAKMKSDSLQSKLDELQIEKDQVCKEKDSLENEVVHLKEVVEKKTQEMSSLRTELKTKEIESEKENVLVINNLKNTLHNAVSERESVVKELADAKEKLLGKDEEICQMSKKIEEYEKKFEDSKTELKAVQEKNSIENDVLNDIINEMNNKMASMNLLKEKLQKEILNVAEHLKSLKMELATVRQLKSDMDDNVKSYMADLKSNLNEITGLTAAVACCDKSMLTDSETLPEREEIERLNLKVVDLEKDLEDNVYMRENFMTEISCLVESLKDKDQQIMDLTKEKSQASEKKFFEEKKINLLESDAGSEHTSDEFDGLSPSSIEKQQHQKSPTKQDNQSPPPKKPARQSAPMKPRRQSLCKKQDGDTQTSPEKQDRVKQTTPEMQVRYTQTSPEKQDRLSNMTKKAKQEENEETMKMEETSSENPGDKHHVNLMKQELGSMASKLESLQKFYDDEKSLNDEIRSELNDVKTKLSEVKASYEAEKSVTHRLRYDLNDVRSSLNEVLESYEQLNLSRSVVLGDDNEPSADDRPEVNEQTIKSLLNELTLPQQDIINALQKQGQNWKRKYEETSMELVSERQKLLDSQHHQSESFYTKAENEKLRKELTSIEKQLKDVQSQHEIQLITMETERMTKELIEERKRSEDRHLQEDMSRLRHQLQLAKENSEKYLKLKIEMELLRSENDKLKKEKLDASVNDKNDDKVDEVNDKQDCKSGKEDMDLDDMSTIKRKENSEETSNATVATQTDFESSKTCDTCEMMKTEKQQLAEKLKVSQKKVLAFEEDTVVAEISTFSRVGSSRQLRREKILAETAKMEAEFSLKVAQEKILTLTKDLEKLQETKGQEPSPNEVRSVASKSCGCQTNDISFPEDQKEFKKLKDDLEMERRRIDTLQQDLQQKSSVIETLKMSLKDQDDTIVELEDIMKRKETRITALEEELLQNDERDTKIVVATSDKCEQCRLSLVEGTAPKTVESSNSSEDSTKDNDLQTVVSNQTKTIQTLSHEKSRTQLTCKNMNLEMQHLKMALAVMESERDSLRKRLEMASGKPLQSPTTNTQAAATQSYQSPTVSAHSAAGKSFQSPAMKSTIASGRSQPSPSRMMPSSSSSSSSSEVKDSGNGAAENTRSMEETTPGNGIMLRNVEQWRKQKSLVLNSIKKTTIEKLAATPSNSPASHSILKHNNPAPNSAVTSRLCNNVTGSLHRSPSTCRTQRLCNTKQNTNVGTSSPVPLKKQVLVSSEPTKTPQAEDPPESAESPPISPGVSTDRKYYREIDVTPPIAIRALRRNRKRKPLETSPQKSLQNSSKCSISSKALNLCHKGKVSDEQPHSSAQEDAAGEGKQLPPRRSKSIAMKKIQNQNSYLMTSPVLKNSPILKKKKGSDSEDIPMETNKSSKETGTSQESPQKSTMDRIRNLKNSFRSSSLRRARNLLKPNNNVSSPVWDSPRNQTVKPSVASTTKSSKAAALPSDTESSNDKKLENVLTNTTTRTKRRLYKDQIIGPMDFVNVTATTTLKPKDDVFNSLMHQLRNRRRETQYKS